MNLESVRQFCLALPHTTEEVQWENHLLLKVGGKMFAILALEPGDAVMSLKTTPERYAELVEIEGIEPCSHRMWKYQWLTVERYNVLRDDELRELLRLSYDLVYAGLTNKARAQLEGGTAVSQRPKSRVPRRKSAAKAFVRKRAKAGRALKRAS